MYLRFVRLLVREGSEGEFGNFYRERAIPALAKTKGCRFAGLLSPWRGEEHRSITLWDSAEDAAAYEESGLYHRLLRESERFLSSRTVWRLRLATDPLETADIAKKEIPPEGYELGASEAAEELSGERRSLFVRLVSIRLDPERGREYVELYRAEVLPALLRSEGCRGAFLAEGASNPNEVMSVSLWDDEACCSRYEMSGEVERLRRKLEATFSPVYAWKLTLGDGAGGKPTALNVATYHLVQGQRLGPQGEPS